jgi:hypothetical protein
MSIFLSQTAFDNFQYPNIQPLPSPPWTVGYSNTLQVVSELCEAEEVGDTALEIYTGTTLPANQYASATISNMAMEALLELTIRQQYESPFQYGYILSVWNLGPGESFCYVDAWDFPSATEVLYVGGLTINDGDVWTIAAIGSTIYVLQNGNILSSATDSTWSSGPYSQLGLQDESATTDLQISLFSIGSASLTASISGNAGVAGATVAYSGTSSGSVTADGSGNYSITGLSAGNYTITPSLAGGWIFNPGSQNVTISNSNLTGVNFTASQQANVGPSTSIATAPALPRKNQLFGRISSGAHAGEICAVACDADGNISISGGGGGSINSIDLLSNDVALPCTIYGVLPSSLKTVATAVDANGNLCATVGSGGGNPISVIGAQQFAGEAHPVQIFARVGSGPTEGNIIAVPISSSGGLGNSVNKLATTPNDVDVSTNEVPTPVVLVGRTPSGKLVAVSLTAAGELCISGSEWHNESDRCVHKLGAYTDSDLWETVCNRGFGFLPAGSERQSLSKLGDRT